MARGAGGLHTDGGIQLGLKVWVHRAHSPEEDKPTVISPHHARTSSRAHRCRHELTVSRPSAVLRSGGAVGVEIQLQWGQEGTEVRNESPEVGQKREKQNIVVTGEDSKTHGRLFLGGKRLNETISASGGRLDRGLVESLYRRRL